MTTRRAVLAALLIVASLYVYARPYSVPCPVAPSRTVHGKWGTAPCLVAYTFLDPRTWNPDKE